MKNDKLHTKIAGQNKTVSVTYETVTDDRLLVRVNGEYDALIACYCYRFQKLATIERAADGGWLVSVIK